MAIFVPNQEGVNRWLLETIRHSNHMEYYCEILGLGSKDSDRPGHDIVGAHNKLEWEVISGCAQTYLDAPPAEKELIMEVVYASVRLHRLQQHHVALKVENPAEEDMLFGSLDTICALLEKRHYYRSIATLDELDKEVENIFHDCSERNQKIGYVLKVSEMMKKVKTPEIGLIDRLMGYPNIGIPESTYELMQARMADTLGMLTAEHGYSFA